MGHPKRFMPIRSESSMPTLRIWLLEMPYNHYIEMSDKNKTPIFAIFWRGIGWDRTQRRGLVWCPRQFKKQVVAMLNQYKHQEEECHDC